MPQLQDRTILPPERDRVLKDLDDLVSTNDTAELHGPDGQVTTIPVEVYQVLRDVVSALRTGQTISIAPHLGRLIPSRSAASWVVSSVWPLIKRLERDELPYTRPGRHRRLRLVDATDLPAGAT